jgi:hypothetical protein
VLTGKDYLGWESKSQALLTDVTAEFQRSTCVFVGYSLSDENMRRVIGIVGGNMGDDAPKHYALIQEVDEAEEAMLGEAVSFVALQPLMVPTVQPRTATVTDPNLSSADTDERFAGLWLHGKCEIYRGGLRPRLGSSEYDNWR